MLSTRNLFLVRGFVRLRADEVLSPRGKVPKGRRGRPKGACLMAAPGPPVAKLQCTASLAGARPARFTSVPGRATVAFGAADPSPGVWAPVYPWSDGKGPSQQDHLAATRASAPEPCKVRARPGTRLVASPRPNQMACPIRLLSVKKQGEVPLSPQGGSGGIPRPFEGGIGGPGGHRGEVGIPPAPLAGGANLQEKRHATLPRNCFFFTDKIILSKEKSFHKPQTLFIPPYTEAKSSFTKLSSPSEAVPPPPLHKRKTLFPSQISFAPQGAPLATGALLPFPLFPFPRGKTCGKIGMLPGRVFAFAAESIER